MEKPTFSPDEDLRLLAKLFDDLSETGEGRGSSELTTAEKDLLKKIAAGTGSKKEISTATRMAADNRQALEFLAALMS